MSAELAADAMIAAGSFLGGWICCYCVVSMHHSHHHHRKG